ncbi:MAG: response regulator transcription factor [Verrucomicrobiae bacterium]|nr:response regulator transcription factor [Verrucomicrobiae bacterium]
MSLFRKPSGRVLVVDDEPLILEMTSVFLKNAGFEAVTAASSAEALRRLAEKPVDAVLLDIRMPDEGGLQALPKFRAAQPDVPVIMLTGVGYEENLMREALEAGANGFVSKDTEMENIVLAIKRVVKQTHGEGETT